MSLEILLHVCCGPCSIAPVRRLLARGFKVTGFFHNPNIQPLAEYLRRRETALECARLLGIELIVDDDWDLVAWLLKQLPQAKDENRCRWCCASRLRATQEKADRLGFQFFSTTLLYSIYQPHDYIAAAGRDLSELSDSRFVYQDFRADWREGVETSKEWGLYRQPYCGCVFSESERYAKKFSAVKKNN